MSWTPLQFLRPRAWLMGINLLSLDAPLVALVWQDFFALCFGLKLAPANRVMLALCAWLAYAADRWLDGLKIPPENAVIARHAFAQAHRRFLAFLWLTVFLLAGFIAGKLLAYHLFLKGLALAVVVGIYFIVNQWRKTAHWLRGIKEIFIALIFAAASVGWILPFHWWRSNVILWAVAGWAMLCFLNCFAIAGWELHQDRAQKQESLVTRWPFLAEHFSGAAGILIAYALLPMLLRPALFPRQIGLALAASAAMLGILNFIKSNGKGRHELLPLLADAALLTPLCFKFF